MPQNSSIKLSYLIKYNWIGMYDSIEGLDGIFRMMKNRLKFQNNLESASQTLKNNYSDIEYSSSYLLMIL